MANIKVKAETHKKLKFFGKFGMTYDDVINNLFEFALENESEFEEFLNANEEDEEKEDDEDNEDEENEKDGEE